MNEVENFIYEKEGAQRELLMYFHSLFTDRLGLTAKIRYKIPFYYQKSWICYLNPKKDGKLDLAFIRANELSNASGLLQAKDRKQIASIELDPHTEIPEEAILEIMTEALELDQKTPYKSKRKGK